jgi:hypothetical protein
MLKRVETSELRLGMFIHKLEGSWFKHPFWKSKFLLEEMWMLEARQGSAVEAVIIDTERGLNNVPVREVAMAGASCRHPGQRRHAARCRRAQPQTSLPRPASRPPRNLHAVLDRRTPFPARQPSSIEARLGRRRRVHAPSIR